MFLLNRTALGAITLTTAAAVSVPLAASVASASSLSTTQRRNVDAIIAVGRELNLPDRAICIALMTAKQESDFGIGPGTQRINREGDSGLFQQRSKFRDGAYYGTVAQTNDPRWAARTFFKGVTTHAGHMPGLLDIDGWERMPLWQAAAEVQVPAARYRKEYDKHKKLALSLLGLQSEPSATQRSRSSDPDEARSKANEQAAHETFDRPATPGRSTQTAAANVLDQGDSGTRVRAAQLLLRARGQHLEADGEFGPRTAAAVRAFQRAQGLADDGVIGPRTWAALSRGLVREGARGDEVRAVQLLTGAEPDGIFGPRTRESVRRSQQAAGIAVDGVVGPQTWGALLHERRATEPKVAKPARSARPGQG